MQRKIHIQEHVKGTLRRNLTDTFPCFITKYIVSEKKLQPYTFHDKIAKSQPIKTKFAENSAE